MDTAPPSGAHEEEEVSSSSCATAAARSEEIRPHSDPHQSVSAEMIIITVTEGSVCPSALRLSSVCPSGFSSHFTSFLC